MKPIIKKILLATLPALFFATAAIAQPPPPPDEHGGDGDIAPAPIGSGLVILLALGAAYGAKKVFDARKKIRK